jgi:hypothetical protein
MTTKQTAAQIMLPARSKLPPALYREMELAIEKALRDEREAKWQPIETAPKDETEIVLACFTSVSIVSINFIASSYWLPACIGSPLLGTDEHCVCCPADPGYKGKWKGWEYVCAYPPTHWQPLTVPVICTPLSEKGTK